MSSATTTPAATPALTIFFRASRVSAAKAIETRWNARTGYYETALITAAGHVVVLGMTSAADDARREHARILGHQMMGHASVAS